MLTDPATHVLLALLLLWLPREGNAVECQCDSRTHSSEGEPLCENHGYSVAQCAEIGCCNSWGGHTSCHFGFNANFNTCDGGNSAAQGKSVDVHALRRWLKARARVTVKERNTNPSPTPLPRASKSPRI